MKVEELEKNDLFEEEVIKIRRVTKVVKGGRNMRFSATVVVGDKNGKVGLGSGTSKEVPLAIKKATDDAKKNLIDVPIIDDTIPHYIEGKFGAAKVVLRPASGGTGIIAGGAIRKIVEFAGIKNILTKRLKSNNMLTNAKATIDGLKRLNTPERIMKKRGISEEELWQ
jgi:small subunit ribosomal protein S5